MDPEPIYLACCAFRDRTPPARHFARGQDSEERWLGLTRICSTPILGGLHHRISLDKQRVYAVYKDCDGRIHWGQGARTRGFYVKLPDQHDYAELRLVL
jgi:hypothetical protein